MYIGWNVDLLHINNQKDISYFVVHTPIVPQRGYSNYRMYNIGLPHKCIVVYLSQLLLCKDILKQEIWNSKKRYNQIKELHMTSRLMKIVYVFYNLLVILWLYLSRVLRSRWTYLRPPLRSITCTIRRTTKVLNNN